MKLSKLTDPYNSTAILLALVLVCIKKWEPGGNLDTIWYSAIGKNIAESGNFFRFYVSEHWQPSIADHMPLLYWITGGMMSWFGVSDFVARLYPMAASVASILFVYAIGKRLAGARFGLLSLFAYALCLGAGKWHGALMHDVPLTTWFLGCVYCLMRASKSPRWFYGISIFFVLGVWTKGPIIFGFGLAMVLWVLTERKWSLLRTRHFVGAAALMVLLLSVLYLPALRFDGRDYYSVFIEFKRSYLAQDSGGFWRYFAFIDVLWTGAFLVIPFFLYSVWRLFADADQENAEFRRWIRLFLWVIVCVVVPLSFFETKFPHYMLPVYPFLALVAASGFRDWAGRLAETRAQHIAIWLRRVAVATAFVFAMTPLKTTGQRSKEVLNTVNLIKLDNRIEEKSIAFLGQYHPWHYVIQTFKFYGSMDLKWVEPEEASQIDLEQAWLIIPRVKLPFEHKGGTISLASCVFENSHFCAVTDRASLQLHAPEERYPHEIYKPISRD